ncbi:hypothetical protein [Actinoplanes teichomyceticus]|uniref:Lipoprotein n=1 Tax=Actinoplanes teichomyceticus TaxID=1867 RepID=A0A561WLM4_ACTTI|nr:hypothetical protein [Actinoplanes teichomyceticus]TWG24755.1 hypothetical protein FHX34_1021315 [Actinoplanes teichomyceticus]GIF14582.1 hypothetical protein Ate01nite_46140 [Actinoplanes teichomyceticus]
MRRRTAAPIALIATAALAAGCEIEVSPESLPAPFSVAPVPSASAGQPKYVCTAVYKILTDGAVKAAAYATGSGDDARKALQKTFADMAGQVSAAGARSDDVTQRAAVDEVAAALTQGSRSADPKAFLNGEFVTVGQKIDATCT